MRFFATYERSISNMFGKKQELIKSKLVIEIEAENREEAEVEAKSGYAGWHLKWLSEKDPRVKK